MKTVFFSKDAQFELEDEEFSAFIKTLSSSKRVWIPRLKVFLSDMFIWAGDKPDDKSRGRLHDGTIVIKKFGQWVDAKNDKVILDPSYYPEITKDEVMSEEEWSQKRNTEASKIEYQNRY
jgi:hypothetical protein